MATRATFTLNESGSEALERMSQETQKSKAELVRDALALLEYVHQSRKEEGVELGLVKNGKLLKEVKIL